MIRALDVALPALRAVRSVATIVSVCLVVAACALSGATPAASAATISPRAPMHWGATGVPIPPPPSWATPTLLARFFSLYTTYVHLPPQRRLSFAEFLVFKGVVDSELFAKLMALYHWYSVPVRAANGRWSSGGGAG